MGILKKTFNLTEEEAKVYAVLLLLQIREDVREAFNCFDYSIKGMGLLKDVIAHILNIKPAIVEPLICQRGKFFELKLIEPTCEATRDAEDLFRLRNSEAYSFVDMLCLRLNESMFLDSRIFKRETSKCKLKDFSHLPEVSANIIPFLKSIKGNKRKGVNILLYGPSGSGKTELSYIISHEAGLTPYTLPYTDEGHWNQWKVGGTLLRNNPQSILTIDEADDYFNTHLVFGGNKRVNKGLIIDSLEQQPVPTIWTTNSIETMDPALIRRFMFVLKVGYPPREKMRSIANQYLGSYLCEENIQRILNSPNISPAVLSQVGDIAKSLNSSPVKPKESQLLSVISDFLKAQGIGNLAESKAINPIYDPNLTNCNADLLQIAQALKKNKSARLCLYGPPKAVLPVPGGPSRNSNSSRLWQLFRRR